MHVKQFPSPTLSWGPGKRGERQQEQENEYKENVFMEKGSGTVSKKINGCEKERRIDAGEGADGMELVDLLGP
ncbi:hypothetical protein QE152_g30002 [Popillia japonica]|uniref:Uncharacterized protein n=1 Tax=Popillia japonica TaxID=7064 RepID=A0AAW1JFV4_POPJA